MKWETVEIGQLGEVITGNTPPRKNPELYGDFIPFIKPTDMEIDRRYTPSPEECYSELGYEKYRKSLIPKGATCVVTIGSIGKKITQAITDCFINQAVNAVIPNENYDADFVFYLLKNNLDKVKGLDSGTSSGRENVSKSSFSSIEVKVVKHLPTQRKIASILSAYDDLIENNLKRIKLLEEKAFVRYKLLVKSEKFEKKAFSEIADYINGYPFKPDDWKEEGLPIIKIKELKAGVQIDTPRNDGENIPEKYFIENKNILFAWSASIGAYLWCTGKSILNQHIFNVKPFDKECHNWLYFSLLEKIPDFINLSNGATMQHIKKSALGMVFLPVPPKKVYSDFQKETEPILDLIVNLYQQNTKLRSARDILLPKLMNGQIEV